MRLLLTRDDINPDMQDHDGQTPLWCASLNGQEGVVKLLLTRGDVNPHKLNTDCQTPLWSAVRMGMRGWCNYFSPGEASIPTFIISLTEYQHLSLMLCLSFSAIITRARQSLPISRYPSHLQSHLPAVFPNTCLSRTIPAVLLAFLPSA